MTEKEQKTPKKSIEQKKAEFLHPAASPKSQQQFPIHLIGMLLILGLLIGAALTLIVFNPKNGNGDDTNSINDVEYRTVPITMLYSDQCNGCSQTNTFEELFLVRNIPYKLEKVEASSEEGKELIEKYSIQTVPTAIIDAKKIEFYPTTKNNFDNVLEKISGAYIAPELNLDAKTYHPVYYLEKIPGYCDANKPTVLQFDDYYTPQNNSARPLLYEFIADFNTSTELKYVFAQSISQDENAVLGNLFLTCASNQQKYPELEYKITGIYCNNPFKGDPEVATSSEIKGCRTISEHYSKPLTQIELDIAAARAKLDLNKLAACIATKETIYNNAKKLIEEIGINRTGTFLINCQETASIDTLRDSFCKINPQACKRS
ncbi:MAG TPA: hypothetical protein VJG83_05010 [archaeon]|nr:hypothetical protein [archaeon]